MMSREERSRRFSVDCPDRVVWKHWSAGGEYVKKLIVKNTFDKLQVLEYKLPQRKATFFVDFPAPVTLSSGMAFELEIKFRPTEMVELHDSIELSVKGRGSFFVQLDALVPYAAIAAPEKHDFEFCAVGTTVEAKAPLKNVGTLPVDYYWDVPAPFQVSPKQGSLEEGATQTMQLSFTPSAALSMVGQAVCKRVGDDVVLGVMKMSGIGKFAFVTFDHGTPESVVDFGEALSQSTNTKVITLMNKSFVPGKFTIKRIDKDIVCPFVLSPMSGTVPRDGLVKIQVKFQPTGSGAELSNSFVLHVAGGNTLRLNCLGTSVGPTASLSTTKVEFGDVNLDTLAADSSAKQNSSSGILDRFVTLKNTTNAAIRFQAVGTNPGAVFAVTPFSGQVPAKGSVALKVTFRPEAPMNYLRRLFILINDTERALYCDFVATAYNSKSRPAPFTAADARAFFTRLEVGLGKCSPDDIAQLIEGIRSGAPAASEDEEAARQAMQLVLQEKESQLAATQADATAASSSSKKKAAAPTLDPSRSVSKTFKASRRVVPLQTLLPEEEHGATTAPFVLDRSVLVFQTAASSADGEVVHVRNNTSAKATASWAIPADTPWSVVPASQDVAPFSTAAFRVRMANQGNGAPYGNASSVGHFLECFVNFKQMRSFRLVNEDTHCPPHCLLLQCQRLVAMTDTAATPQVDAVSQVAFPPCHERSKVLQVVTLRNMGDTVAAFRVQIETQTLRAPQQEGIIVDDELAVPATVFSCFPSTGVIPPKESTLVLLTFSPPTADRFVGMAKVLLNDSPLGSLQIALRGEGFVPSLQLESDGVLTFRPTSVGGCTTRSFHLTNPSRIPVRFEATVPSALADVVRLQPSSGVLKGCEKLAIQAQFYPQQARRYDTSLVFAITAEQPPNSVLDSNGQPPVSRMTCHVQGEGMLGVVAVEPLTLSYGNFLVGESGTQQLSIINSSLCDLQYDTRWCIRSGTMEEGITAPEFINGRGVIRARSHVNVHVTIKPVRGSFEFLLYVLVGGHEDIYQAPDPPLQEVLRMPHCIATATGAYPSIQITDVRSVLQPKSLLWRQLSVGKINASLAESVTPSVDLENCAYNFLQQVEGLEAIHVDVGVDVFRSPPMKVLVRLDNVGLCRATYSIRLPDESDIPTEPWHHEKLLEDNLSEVLDARLLDIQPREASIDAGGHILLTISYRHTRVGHHQLPVLLRLNKGKKVLLVLHARTLDEGGKYLRFHHSMQHAFAPVAIGELEPPLQYTELQNLSQNAVSYALDESALAQLQEANYDFPILQCLNPAGVIPPMSTLLLSWYFRPLEPKSYEATVRVQVEGSQDYSLVLQGRGFHPKKCTPEEIQQMHRDSFLSIPKYPTLSHPLLPMRLSMDVLRFGAVPFHSLHRQMVTLRNDHQRDTFVFEWHCVLQFGDQIFDVDPPRGRLAPGESVHCRITLYTGSTSHIIDNPIHCHVLNESLRERRAAKRAVANKEAAMQLDAPHTTPEGSAAGDAAAASSRRTTRKTVGGGAAPRIRQPVVGIPPKFQTTERLKETIQKVTDAVVGEDVSEDADELAEVEVLPTVLELLVQARIVSLEAFHEVYGELASRSMFFPTLQAFTSRIEPSDCIDLSRNATEQEWRLAHEVLDTLLKQAVHHHRIEESFLDAGEDPIPYFCEMSTTTTNDITAPLLAVRTASSSEGPETSQDETTAATSTATAAVGEERCLAEEVLESAIFSLVKGICDADESMVKSIFKRRQ